MTNEKILAAVNNPVFWKMWNLPEGREFRKMVKELANPWISDRLPSEEECEKYNNKFFVRIKGAKLSTILYFEKGCWFDEYDERYPVKAWLAVPDYYDTEDAEEDILKSHIDLLKFSTRTYNCLKRAGITTVEDLTTCTHENLVKIRGFGNAALKEIDDKLKEQGLSVRKD